MPLTILIPTGRSILLRQSKQRPLTESMPCWLTSCNKVACAKNSLFYWFLVDKIMPGWNRFEMHVSFPIPGLINFPSINAFISPTILDPCIMMGEWRCSWGAVKVICSSKCRSCANTDSGTRYNTANHVCAPVLYDWVFDMDLESAIKAIMILLLWVVVR